jgi:hypothetical protein
VSIGVYKASVEDHWYKARMALNEAQKTYEGLRDKTTPYAVEIQALAKLHAQVAQVWDQAARNEEGSGN